MEPRSRRYALGFDTLASIVALLACWEFASLLTASRMLPSPEQVAAVLWQEARHGPLLHHIAVTLARVGASFAVAMLAGSALGYALGRWPPLDRWVKPWLMLLLNLPALVIIILAYVWLGLGEAALLTAVVLNKLPTVAVTLREGARRLDRDLAEMAALYHFGWWTRLRYLAFPQLAPYAFSAARNGLAIVWKIVLIAEFLGRSDGVGFQLQTFFQNFDIDRILAYSVAFSAIVLAFEYAVLSPLERRLDVWRR